MKKIGIIFLFMMTVWIVSCSQEQTPADIVVEIYTVGEADFDTVRPLFVPLMEESEMEDVESSTNAVEAEDVLLGIWREQTSGFTVKKVEVVQEKVSEENGEARLILKLTFEDGAVQEEIPADLILMDGQWLLAVE